MAQGKVKFIAYPDWGETFDELTDEQAGRLIKHIFDYVRDKDPKAPDQITKIAFASIRAQLKRDLSKWSETRNERSKAGALGNLKRYEPDLYGQVVAGKMTLEDAQNVANARKTSQTVAKLAVNVNVNDNVILKEKDTKKKSGFSFRKSLLALGLDKGMVDDFLKNRKLKRLANTETAFKNLKNEMEKTGEPLPELFAEIVANGWGSFKASWDRGRPSQQKSKTASDDWNALIKK